MRFFDIRFHTPFQKRQTHAHAVLLRPCRIDAPAMPVCGSSCWTLCPHPLFSCCKWLQSCARHCKISSFVILLYVLVTHKNSRLALPRTAVFAAPLRVAWLRDDWVVVRCLGAPLLEALLVCCACVFSCKVSTSPSNSKTHTPAPFSLLVIVLSVFRCWRMTFAMRSGLCLLFVDALCSSLQHVIGSPADVCAYNWLSVLFCSTQLPDLWFLLHFVADVKGRFLVVVMLVLA